MEEFQNNIKQWVTIDNNIKTLSENLKDLKAERSQISDNILNFVEQENLNTTTIQINDGALKFTKTKQTSNLTLSYVKECLEKCISNEDDINTIMNVIKTSRESKYSNEIKRSYKN
ncbi:MAG: hypothetical protein CMD14_00815 [Flavobacteriales bacterium]|nr:hypothetical protein [Flavobacteriales bacterium]|tara:strand:- start:1467 stop:1814 length:348 start_codon:yes stop_codon:yes gene_type:complete